MVLTEAQRLKERFASLLKNEGVGSTLVKASDKLLVYASCPFKKQHLKDSTFHFWGETHHLFCHHYNATWRNERSVEIALALEKLRQNVGREILEVGNVMGYYFPVAHTVVDKYEVVHGVENVDIIDLITERRFDLVLSISTLEHVGWDETPREPEKFLIALERLRGLLARGGELFATVPLGYNPHLDERLSKGEIPASRIGYLKRLAKNVWREATSEEVAGTRYNHPFSGANAIAVIRHLTA